MLVLYASGTGTAEELALYMVDKLRRCTPTVEVRLKQFGQASLADLENEVIIVICSTTGDGQLPENAQPTWNQLLRKSLTPFMQNSQFYSFGLGSTAYAKYNYAIQKIFARFVKLGAQPAINAFLSDENSAESYDDFERWSDLVLESLDIKCTNTAQLPPLYPVKMIDAENHNGAKFAQEPMRVCKNNRISAPDHFQDVRQIIFQETEPNGDAFNSIDPGDCVSIHPKNDPKQVEALLISQKWESLADRIVEVDGIVPAGGWVTPLTLRNLITWHLDLNSPPLRTFFTVAQHFCTNPDHAERMQQLSVDSDDRYAYISRVKRSVIEVLLEFDLDIKIEHLLDLFKLITPRKYSISGLYSDGSSQSLEITIAVVKYSTFLKRLRRGLCTHYLQSLPIDAPVYLTITKSKLDLARCATRKCFFVATGTGIAPIKLLLTQLKFEVQPTLFYGTRYDNKDYLYGKELESKAEVVSAFSRQGGGYVQQKIAAYMQSSAYNLEDCIVFVCGSAGAMPRAVKEAFASTGANIARMEKMKTYIEDTW